MSFTSGSLWEGGKQFYPDKKFSQNDIIPRRIIVTGHVEVLASPKAVLTHEYHLMVGQQIKVRDPPPLISNN